MIALLKTYEEHRTRHYVLPDDDSITMETLYGSGWNPSKGHDEQLDPYQVSREEFNEMRIKLRKRWAANRQYKENREGK